MVVVWVNCPSVHDLHLLAYQQMKVNHFDLHPEHPTGTSHTLGQHNSLYQGVPVREVSLLGRCPHFWGILVHISLWLPALGASCTLIREVSVIQDALNKEAPPCIPYTTAVWRTDAAGKLTYVNSTTVRPVPHSTTYLPWKV